MPADAMLVMPGLAYLPEALCKIQGLEELDLSYCNLHDLEKMIDLLSKCSGLKKLKVNLPLDEIPSSLEKLQQLRYLEFTIPMQDDPSDKKYRTKILNSVKRIRKLLPSCTFILD